MYPCAVMLPKIWEDTNLTIGLLKTCDNPWVGRSYFSTNISPTNKYLQKPTTPEFFPDNFRLRTRNVRHFRASEPGSFGEEEGKVQAVSLELEQV